MVHALCRAHGQPLAGGWQGKYTILVYYKFLMKKLRQKVQTSLEEICGRRAKADQRGDQWGDQRGDQWGDQRGDQWGDQWGDQGRTKVLLGPVMPYQSTPCGPATPKQPYGRFNGGYPQGRRPSSTPLDTPRRTEFDGGHFYFAL